MLLIEKPYNKKNFATEKKFHAEKIMHFEI